MRKLIRLLRTKDLTDRKVLVFTEFADTARYVESRLHAAGVSGLARIDGGSTVDRAGVIRRFSPYYNGANTAELRKRGEDEIRVLISTDVLSEGLNLQDATRLINYDLHWNPVRLMQRIGRVDRRMSPEVERCLEADHPESAADRGTVRYWNFLPPDDLERVLKLYERVTGKTLLISNTLGIEGRKLLRPDDDYDPLREFNANYEGTRTTVEEMHLEYQLLCSRSTPTWSGGSMGCPVRSSRVAGSSQRGYAAFSSVTPFPLSTPAGESSRWRQVRPAGTCTAWTMTTIVESPNEIVSSIRSRPNTPRRCSTERENPPGSTR